MIFQIVTGQKDTALLYCFLSKWYHKVWCFSYHLSPNTAHSCILLLPLGLLDTGKLMHTRRHGLCIHLMIIENEVNNKFLCLRIMTSHYSLQ
jgi:hypothetical protein